MGDEETARAAAARHAAEQHERNVVAWHRNPPASAREMREYLARQGC